MQKVTHREARKRYLRLFWPAMIIYTGAIIGGAIWRNQYETTPVWLGLTITIAVSIPLIAVMFLMVRYFMESDEFVRLQQLTAFAYGACITVSAIFVAGFLQMFDVVGYIEVFWFGPAFFFAYGIVYKLMGGKDCA